MFSVQERDSLRAELTSAARGDAGVSSAALLGSSANGPEDRWSDIDLALCLAADADRESVIAGWTDRMYREHAAVDHLDLVASGALYRVFLLASTLQVDLSFWPPGELRAFGARFRMLFGEAAEQLPASMPRATDLIGWGWLYLLHARASIARGRPWQAEYMISGARDKVLALACLRHRLSAWEARGTDELPAGVRGALIPALVGSLEPAELARALSATTDALLAEAEYAEPVLAERLAGPLRELLIDPRVGERTASGAPARPPGAGARGEASS